MAKVTGFTAERMLDIEQSSIISAAIEGGDELVFYTKGGGRIRAGAIKPPNTSPAAACLPTS